MDKRWREGTTLPATRDRSHRSRGTHVTMRRTRSGGTTLLRLLALLAVLGLVAAACGGDDETLDENADENPETEGAQEFPVQEGDPVTGGNLVLAAICQQMFGTVALLIATLLFQGMLPTTALLLPILLIPQLLAALGLA